MINEINGFPAFLAIDKVIHEPARFAVMSLLSVVDEADFLFVMNNLCLTQGNLSSHLKKLEEAGYVDITKTFKGKRPLTILKLSDKGREELEKYIAIMRKNLNVSN